jgi:hypothetical protein
MPKKISTATEEEIAGLLLEIKAADDQRIVENLEILLDPDKEYVWELADAEDPGYREWWVKTLTDEMRIRGLL